MRFRTANTCVNQAIEIKDQICKEINNRETEKQEQLAEQGIEYDIHYSLEDLRKVQDACDQVKHHIRIRNTFLLDNGASAFNKLHFEKRK
jgi:hypothetical protein